MARSKLTAIGVKRLVQPGRYGDGDGLWLQVRDADHRSWLFRYTRHGRARAMGLGTVDDVTLAQARLAAQAARDALRAGVDPLERRQAAARAAREAASSVMTFRAVADLLLDAKRDGWRNPKHGAQWVTSLTAASDLFGSRPIASIETGDVLRLVAPIWKTTPESASRLRGGVEAVLDYATARGWRHGENPARWKGHLANLLAARAAVQRVEHHAALPWQQIGAFMAALRSETGTGARALAWTILTAARTGETIGTRLSEIDRVGRVWTVPADRMKAGREHTVPLSDAALALLDDLTFEGQQPSDFLFAGSKPGVAISNMTMAMVLKRMGREAITVHGFRSTFRDWCAEATNYPREIAEASLAHTLRDKVEAAYQRGAMLEKRRKVMQAWSDYCNDSSEVAEQEKVAEAA